MQRFTMLKIEERAVERYMNKVVIGLSGGVDSSVAAYLLKEQGYEVVGVTMDVRQEGMSSSEIEDARRVADFLGIEYKVVDYRERFKEIVIGNFISEYSAGRTPNPCIICNRMVKWAALFDYAEQNGIQYVATGHYASIGQKENGRYTVFCGSDALKDQSYMLYALTQKQLASTIMPLGGYTKEKIRKIAAEIGLCTAEKNDSMEICFIPDNDYVSFILKNSDRKYPEGNFVDMNGNILGKHKGVINYTVGQRKGLGIAFGVPMFVKKIDTVRNEVILASNDELFSDTVSAENVSLMSVEKIEPGMRVSAKIRYSHKAQPARIWQNEDGTLKCVFDEKQRAATPGQSLVIYDNDCILGGGTII